MSKKHEPEVIMDLLNGYGDQLSASDLYSFILDSRERFDENDIQKIYGMYGSMFDENYIGEKTENSGIVDAMRRRKTVKAKLEVYDELNRLLNTRKKVSTKTISFGVTEEVTVSLEALAGSGIGGSCYLLRIEKTNGEKLTFMVDLGAKFEIERSTSYCPSCDEDMNGLGDTCPTCNAPTLQQHDQAVKPPIGRWDLYDKIKDVDVMLFTHAHLDHVGFAPLITTQGSPFYTKEVPMFAHHLTQKAMYILLRNMHDTVMQNGNFKCKLSEKEEVLMDLGWDRADLQELMHSITPVNYEQEISVEHNNTKLCDQLTIEFLNAGHELGSSMILIAINGIVILFTGDFNTRKTTMILDPASPSDIRDYITEKYGKIDLLISEGTYAGNREKFDTRDELVEKFATILREAYPINGETRHVFLPVYGSRVSEMTLLFEAWQKKLLPELAQHGNFHVLIDGVAKQFFRIFRELCIKAPVSTMEIREFVSKGKNPFLRPPTFTSELCDLENWRYIKGEGLQPVTELDEQGLYVIFTTAGMLSGGPILEYIRRYGANPDDTIVLTGYMAEGTVGYELKKQLHKDERIISFKDLSDNTQVISLQNQIKVLHLSHHASERNIIDLIKTVTPRHLFFLHTPNEDACQEMINNLKTIGAIERGFVGTYPPLTIRPQTVVIELDPESTRSLHVISTITGKSINEIVQELCREVQS